MSQLDKLKVRIPYDVSIHGSQTEYEAYLNSLLEDTEDIALNQLYPFLVERPSLPAKYLGWQLRACEEINETAGLKGLKKYSENGLSFEKATDSMLSISLMNELVPYAGVPERNGGTLDD